ncbi:unnamed protein product [Brachionus calyciflorus]|uniref:Uncharacterized protein n=1 Tax=Brachionus calyciflorus TaxID=104777 RepID=A0A814BKU6_9BILA|nr:unnamed protein product [Brachionus calyciflorus]
MIVEIFQIISLIFADFVSTNELFIRVNTKNEPSFFQDKTIVIHEFRAKFRLGCIKKCLHFDKTCKYFQFNKSKKECKIYNSIEKQYFYGKNDIYKRDKLLPRIHFLNGSFLDRDQLFDMLISINIIGKGLSQIGPFAFEKCDKTELLDLSFNNLTKLYSKSFYGMVKLNTLNLSCNQISQLESDVFTGLPLLTNLDLKNNNLRYLGGNIFNNLPQLQNVYLEFNQIESIEKYTFKNLEKIKRIILKNNNLKSLEPIFYNTSSSFFLDVSSNQIKIVHNDTFKSLNKLFSLYISFNQISELNAEMFRGADYLETLFITTCKIEKINENFFKNIPILKWLDISRNNLSSIEPGAFKSLLKLEYLNLFSCNIKAIDLSSLQNLKFLFLGTNQISYFSQNLSSLTDLILNTNPLINLNYSVISSQNSSLLNLSIVNCQLKYIDFDILKNFTYLQSLNLISNSLTLTNDSFIGFKSLKRLLLNENEVDKFKILYPNITVEYCKKAYCP